MGSLVFCFSVMYMGVLILCKILRNEKAMTGQFYCSSQSPGAYKSPTKKLLYPDHSMTTWPSQYVWKAVPIQCKSNSADVSSWFLMCQCADVLGNWELNWQVFSKVLPSLNPDNNGVMERWLLMKYWLLIGQMQFWRLEKVRWCLQYVAHSHDQLLTVWKC